LELQSGVCPADAFVALTKFMMMTMMMMMMIMMRMTMTVTVTMINYYVVLFFYQLRTKPL